MQLAEARSYAIVGVAYEGDDPQADHAALRKLAIPCQRFGPWVALDHDVRPDGLIVDITGCAPFFGGEKRLAMAAIADLRERGFWARAAIADTITAAWGIVRFGETGRITIVPPGQQLEALLPLPIAALRLPHEVQATLDSFHVRRVKELLALPRADLPSRFGSEVLLQIDRALGRVPEAFVPEACEEPIDVTWSFEPPTADRGSLENALDHLIGLAMKRVEARRVGVTRLSCSIRTSDRNRFDLPIALMRASTSATHLMELLRLQMERVRLTDEAIDATIRVVATGPIVSEQGGLFTSGADDRRPHLPGLIERLSSRLGRNAVRRPRLLPDPQPELAVRFDPWDVVAKQTGDCHRPSFRPTSLLREPAWLAPATVATLKQFHWRGRSHSIARVRGPERVETGWWRDSDLHRDYFVAETSVGQRFWLFLSTGGWFLHGEWS